MTNCNRAQFDWMQAERISNEDHVDEALRNFREDPTADNATGIVQAALTVWTADSLAQRQPAAWLHTMDNTDGLPGNDPRVDVTLTPDNPYGRPGINYSEEYPVTSEPLYRGTGPSLDDILNCYSPDDTVGDYQDKIRALFGAAP